MTNPLNEKPSDNGVDFRKQLEALLNCSSMENGSDTPDFILAGYLSDCLKAFDRAVTRREVWYGRKTAPLEPGPQMPHSPFSA